MSKIIKQMNEEVMRRTAERCRERGILEVRLVHGKGTGQLRRTVHAALDRLDFVVSYRSAGEDRGGWGATLVMLQASDDASADPS